MDGVARLASLFKERENQPYLGPQIGVVVSPLPDIKIKLNDKVILDKEDLIIAEHLVKKDAVKYNLKSTDSSFEISGDLPGENDDSSTIIGALKFFDGTKPADPHSILEFSLAKGTDISHSGQDATSALHQEFTLRTGEEVILIPSTDEQRYFVIDKVVRP